MKFLDRLFELLITMVKVLVVTIIVIAGFIGLGRILSWMENGFSGVSEDRSILLGFRVLGCWLLAFLFCFGMLMYLPENTPRSDRYFNYSFNLIVVGFFLWLIGLFGYILDDLKETESVDQ